MKLIDYDPTPDHRYCEWLSTCQDSLLEEDVDLIRQTLSSVGEDISVNNFKDPYDLSEYLSKFHTMEEDLLHIRHRNRIYAQKAIEKSKIFENDKLKIVIPLSKISQEYWSDVIELGKKKSIEYEFLLIFPDQRSLRCLIHINNGHFMNFSLYDQVGEIIQPTNRFPSRSSMEEYWPYIGDFLMFLFWEHGLSNYLPNHIIDRKMVEYSLHKSPISIKRLSPDILDENLYKDYMRLSYHSFQDYPEKFQTQELWEYFIRENTTILNLSSVFDEKFQPWITEEIASIAIKKRPELFQYLPEELKTREICKIFLQNMNGVPFPLDWIPYQHLDEEMLTWAFKYNACVLFDFPKDRISDSLCREMIKRTGKNYAYIPDEFRTKELALMALNHPEDPISFYCSEMADFEKYLTEEEVNHYGRIAIIEDIRFLSKMPNLIDEEGFLFKVIDNNPFNISLIPR